MKILICGKGGSGKSTVVSLLATAMHRRGKRVLLVDADESNIGLYRMLGLSMPVSVVLNRLPPEVDKDLSAALKDVPIIGRIPDS